MSVSRLLKKISAMIGLVSLSLLIALPAMAGITGKISGKVIDKSSKDGLPGVSVRLDGTTMGAMTDLEGRYSINNIRPGEYTLKVSSVGYKTIQIGNVHVTADLTTKHDLVMEETILEGETVVITGQRDLVQKDQTATVRVASAEEIENLPVRDYKSVVGTSAGVVAFESNGAANNGRGGTATTASNLPTLNVRGGRSNQVAFIVDGASVQDPITGNTTVSIAPDAIGEIVIMTGGFNAEYGRIMSGAVNVTTKRGQKAYHGKVGALTDNLGLGSEPQDYNIYDLSFSGPLIPGNDKINFFFSGSRTWQGNRTPRANIATDIYDIVANTETVTLPNGTEIVGYSQKFGDNIDKLSNGVLANNETSSWSWSGKFGFDMADNVKLDVSFLGSSDNFHSFTNTYVFNSNHNTYFEDRNSAVNAKLTYQASKKTFVTVGGNYFATERFTGDGVHKRDLRAYGRPGGIYLFDQTQMFVSWDDINGATDKTYKNRGWNQASWGAEAATWDSVTFVDDGDESYVYDDYFLRSSSYVGMDVDVTSQVHEDHEVKFGFDVQRHELRYFDNVFPTRSAAQYVTESYEKGNQDVDQYGYRYDPISNKVVEDDDPTGNGVDGPKKPTTLAFYLQDKFEYEGLVLNFGMRYDYVDPKTKRLKYAENPLSGCDPEPFSDDDRTIPNPRYDPACEGHSNSKLESDELVASKAQTAFSPRLGIGFPVTDRTVFHASYGWFYQQPNLFDMYVSYRYLEYMITDGGYFNSFGNPNLNWEKTIAYEVGLSQQLSETSALEVTAYYKTIEDLVQVRQVRSTPSGHASYRNSDFGTVKGFDFSYFSQRLNNLQMNLSYSLSWAAGTGSGSNSTRNIAWTGEEPPRTTAALDFDQRHKATFSLDYRYKADAPVALLNNFGVNVLGSFASGTPYTPQKPYNEATLGSAQTEPAGPINSRYMSGVFRMDLKANKSFKLGGLDMNVYVWVLNLLDRNNATDAWEASGDPQSTGFLNTDLGRAAVNDPAVANPHDSSGLTATQKYILAEHHPSNYDVPRLVRFGVDLNF